MAFKLHSLHSVELNGINNAWTTHHCQFYIIDVANLITRGVIVALTDDCNVATVTSEINFDPILGP